MKIFEFFFERTKIHNHGNKPNKGSKQKNKEEEDDE